MDIQPGVLYVVGTPIGNLEDMTFRAIQVLQQVSLIAAEDTRHTGRLLQHFQIKTPQISYHQHNRNGRLTEILHCLAQGEAIALVSDAGMPGISDPGFELVKACLDNGFRVVPIPGVSASLTALSAAGLPTDRFVFEGFLPSKGRERQLRLQALRQECRTIILYEAPHRLLQTLQDLAAGLGPDRPIVLGRELTKLHEEFWRGSLEAALSHWQHHPPRGEFTLVVSGACPVNDLPPDEAEIRDRLATLLQQGISLSQASRLLAAQTTLSRRTIYQISLTLTSAESAP